MGHVVATRDIRQRLITGITARDGFAALMRRQLARAAEQHAMGPRALAAFTGAGNDQVPLELGQPTKHALLPSWQGVSCKTRAKAPQTDQYVSGKLENRIAGAGRDERDGFAEWLAKNPEPKLEDLIKKFGSYAGITKDGWAEFDRQMADWQEHYRNRHFAGPERWSP